MSPIPGVNLDKLLGSLLIGTWASSLLTAYEMILAYQYLSNNNDGLAIRGPIVLALVNDAACMLSEFAMVYLYCITHWGDATALVAEPWPLPMFLMTAGFAATITQTYLITRVNRLFRNSIFRIPLVGALSTMCIFCLVGTLAAGIRTIMYPSVLERDKALMPVMMSLAGAAATDVCVTIVLVAKLLTLQKSHFSVGAPHESRLQGFIQRIILRTVETGSFPTIIASISLAFYVHDSSSNVGVGLSFILGRVYTCTFLYSLISRNSDSMFASASGGDSSGGRLSFGRLANNGRSAKSSGVHVNRLATVTVEEPFELGDIGMGQGNDRERPFPVAMRSGNQVFVIGTDGDDKLDWKDHKPFCDDLKKYRDTLETQVLASPLSDVVRTDLETFETLTKDELWVYLRTIVRFGRADDIYTKETVVLAFDYDPKPERVRERFTLREAGLTPSQALSELGDGCTFSLFARDQIDFNISEKMLDHERGYHKFRVLLIAFYKERQETRQRTQIHGPRYAFHPEVFPSIYGPLDEFELRPDWEDSLRIALKGPQRGVPEMVLEDMTACVGEERAWETFEGAVERDKASSG